MKSIWKKIFLLFLAIVIIAIVFFSVDLYRAKNGKSPIFCINYGTLKDGGSKEYIGLGYKVIVYHKLNGYKNMHIGTLFMKYDSNLGGDSLILLQPSDNELTFNNDVK